MSPYRCALAALVLCSYACSKRAAALQPTPDDLLTQICQTEARRHDDGGGIILFGNRAMDTYRATPGEPAEIINRLKHVQGVCRGALIQLLVEFHFETLDRRFKKITADWAEQDWLYFAHALSRAEGRLFEKYTLVLLAPHRPAAVRKVAVNRLTQFDQLRYQKELGRLVTAYHNDGQLAHLLLHLDLDRLPKAEQWLGALFDHENTDLHRDIMLAWSTSDREDKQTFIGRYRNHPAPALRSFAESILSQLGDRQKLGFETNISHVDVAGDGDRSMQNQAFIEAVYRLDAAAAEAALDRGADLNARDQYGTPALHICMNRWALRYPPQAYRHLAKGVYTHVKQIQANAKTLTELLLALGADTNIRLKSGETPLYHAAMFNLGEAARMLLNHGADLELRNEVGFAPVDIARTMENEDMVALLQ